MGTAATTIDQKTETRILTIPIEIGLDPINPQKIKVTPDRFQVKKGAKEEVQWLCRLPHTHGHNRCFLVHFGEEGSPFAGSTFVDDGVRSGHAVVQPDENKFYKYTVWVSGYDPVDPYAGVTP